MSDPVFLTLDDVLFIHDQQLQAFGGQDGVRDRGLLESAVAMPEASWGGEYLHADLFEMAAAYTFHIAENQPFIDGNKRTALNAGLAFLYFNFDDVRDPRRRLYNAMIAVSAKTLDKAGLAELFRSLVAK